MINLNNQYQNSGQEQFNPLLGMANYGSNYQAPSAITAGIGDTTGVTATANNGYTSSLGDLFSKNSLFGGTDAKGIQSQGWAMPVIGAASGVAQGLLGMKQLGLAQDQFKQSKKEFDLNYNAQKTLTNSQLEDRQRARVASSPSAYQSVGDYMNKNKVV